jgi:hypothetical protein
MQIEYFFLFTGFNEPGETVTVRNDENNNNNNNSISK